MKFISYHLIFIQFQECKNSIYASVHKYEVEVLTGNHWAAETDADLFVTIFGDKGDTGRRKLYHSYQEGDKFQRGKVEPAPPPVFLIN